MCLWERGVLNLFLDLYFESRGNPCGYIQGDNEKFMSEFSRGNIAQGNRCYLASRWDFKIWGWINVSKECIQSGLSLVILTLPGQEQKWMPLQGPRSSSILSFYLGLCTLSQETFYPHIQTLFTPSHSLPQTATKWPPLSTGVYAYW